MSLRVWLPLTKDLRNQGLDNVAVINNGATFNSEGKLGGCYQFGSSKNIKIMDYATTFSSFSEFSLSVWFKCTAKNTNHTGSALISCGNWNAPTHLLNLALGEFSTDHYTKLFISNNSTWSVGYSYNFQLNTWYHVVLTSGDSKMKAYVNGQLIGDSISAIIPTQMEQSWICIGNGTYSTIFPFNGFMNDVRIYDNCLSQMEVEELSKGLVLHYPLADPYIEDTLNYLGAKSDTFTSWGSYGFGGKGIITIDTIQTSVCGGQVAKVTNKTTSTSNSTTEIATTFTSIATTVMQKNEKFTFSAYVKGDDSTIGKACYLHIYNTNGTDTSSRSSSPIILTDKWQRMVYTYTWPYDTASKNNGNCYVYVSMKGGESFYVCNAQVEKKDHVTPFTSSSRTTNTVYDTSGFCNNGTISGELTISDDSPKYNFSTYFASGNYVLTDTGTFSWFNFDKCTLAAWFKPTTTPTGYSGSIGISHNQNAGHKSFCISNYGGKFTVYSTNGNYVNTRSNALPINEWHHCAATLDGISLKMYIDGELVKTAELDWGSTGIANDTRFQVGVDLPGTDEMYVGYYSDIRMYATALSADDIKTLYNSNKL